MKKRIIALFFVTTTLIVGCGGSSVVEEYPYMDNEQVKESAQNATEETVSANISGDTVKFDITDSKGNTIYSVNAEKKEDDNPSYTVVQIGYQEFDDTVINELVNCFFDEGSVRVLMPYYIGETDYLDERSAELKSRKEKYEGAGEEVPRYIEEELKNIEKVLGMPSASKYEKIPCPDTPKYIDLVDYYSKKGVIQDEIGFSYVEGTIDGVYYRMDYISFMNSRSLRLYREQSNTDIGEFYTLLEKDEYLPQEEGAIARKEAEEKFVELLKKFVDGDIPTNSITTYPARVYGNMDNQDLLYQKSGYQCFYSADVDGHVFPTTMYTNFYGTDYVGTNLVINPQNLVDIAGHESILDALTIEKTDGSDTYYNGYQSIGACFDSDGLVELYITNPMGDAGQNFKYIQNTPMISFEEVNERASAYLKYIADNYSTSSVTEINHIELGMCRIVSNDDYFLIPAWYYLTSGETGSVLERPVVVVNAIDGTIIDVSKGGVVVEF